ncbi:hypothetical protein GCM10007100_10430 [Roseibacillus persicicus]|uniref:DUF218 domain-containing protein n=1 Tax=Roseibacillus persicicus TaxID=454148 RepID=A0A918TL19_9BACT|nr:hypothetical protein GCM10007100_10430 [Roseibacillus persicicus]
MRRKRVLFSSLGLLLVLWCTGVANSIWQQGRNDEARNSDCVIVLGAAVSGSSPSPVFEERLRHGISLVQSGRAPVLLLTGGVGEGNALAESEVGESYAQAAGVAPAMIFKETSSRTTRENLVEAKRVMNRHGLKTAVIVSDPLHLRRASAMAKGLGMNVVTSPTPTTRYRSLKTQIPFLLREVYFLHHYWIFRR